MCISRHCFRLRLCPKHNIYTHTHEHIQGWNYRIIYVPSNSNHSMILCLIRNAKYMYFQLFQIHLSLTAASYLYRISGCTNTVKIQFMHIHFLSLFFSPSSVFPFFFPYQLFFSFTFSFYFLFLFLFFFLSFLYKVYE